MQKHMKLGTTQARHIANTTSKTKDTQNIHSQNT